MNGDMAVRSISASISARAERIMPLINSRVIGSTCVVIAVAPQQVNEQIAVEVNHGLLAGKDHGGSVQLLDNGWPGQHVRCLQRGTRIYRRRAKTLTREIDWACLYRGRR